MGPDVRRSELIAAISLATDVGIALPLESGLSTCLVACALAERLNLSLEQGQRIYHLALLRNGASPPPAPLAAVIGDEMVMREHSGLLDYTRQ